MDYSTDTLLNNNFVIVTLAIIIGLFLILAFYVNLYLPFKKERDYIKMEMGRSYEEEYRYWKHELKMLYISKVPIVRSVVRRKYKR